MHDPGRLLPPAVDGEEDDSLTMTAGTYNHPGRGTPFDERNPEAVKSMLREELRRQAERDEAIRQGQLAEQRREGGIHTPNTDRKEGK